MSDYCCHLCGEEMEVDTLLLQGDTCDLCLLQSIPPQVDTYVPPMELMVAAVLAEAHEAV